MEEQKLMYIIRVHQAQLYYISKKDDQFNYIMTII